MLDINELRTLLKFEGIDLSNYSDDELSILVSSKSRELTGLLGLDITPAHRRQHISKFRGDRIRLDFYPVIRVASIHYSQGPLKPCDYHVDYDLGIITFNNKLNGNIDIKYLSGLSDDVQNTLIEPLLRDMVAYTFTYNQYGFGDGISSIREGDVSINYDTSNSRGNRIVTRINDIKNKYCSARLRWL